MTKEMNYADHYKHQLNQAMQSIQQAHQTIQALRVCPSPMDAHYNRLEGLLNEANLLAGQITRLTEQFYNQPVEKGNFNMPPQGAQYQSWPPNDNPIFGYRSAPVFNQGPFSNNIRQPEQHPTPANWDGQLVKNAHELLLNVIRTSDVTVVSKHTNMEVWTMNGHHPYQGALVDTVSIFGKRASASIKFYNTGLLKIIMASESYYVVNDLDLRLKSNDATLLAFAEIIDRITTRGFEHLPCSSVIAKVSFNYADWERAEKLAVEFCKKLEGIVPTTNEDSPPIISHFHYGYFSHIFIKIGMMEFNLRVDYLGILSILSIVRTKVNVTKDPTVTQWHNNRKCHVNETTFEEVIKAFTDYNLPMIKKLGFTVVK